MVVAVCRGFSVVVLAVSLLTDSARYRLELTTNRRRCWNFNYIRATLNICATFVIIHDSRRRSYIWFELRRTNNFFYPHIYTSAVIIDKISIHLLHWLVLLPREPRRRLLPKRP
jgi:hypothetical protein